MGIYFEIFFPFQNILAQMNLPAELMGLFRTVSQDRSEALKNAPVFLMPFDRQDTHFRVCITIRQACFEPIVINWRRESG